MSLKFSLLLPSDYINDATKLINQAKTRVSLITMVIADDSSTSAIVHALIDAANRGVKVEVAADIFTYLELGGILLPTKYRSRQSRLTTQMSKNLINNGIKFTWLGRSHTTLISGRTHIKWCIVDDTIYSFGGVNLYQEGISNNDYMLKTTNQQLADDLVSEYQRLAVADAGSYAYRSHSLEVGEDEILIDGGLFGDSIIYRRACQLTAQASKVTLVSQYCPTGKLNLLLKRTKAKLYFNPPERAEGINRFVIQAGMLLTGNHSLYKKKQYLHAKFMLFEMKDGTKVALTGSHNFVNAGVLLGTREIALQTKNPLIIKQLEDFLANSVA